MRARTLLSAALLAAALGSASAQPPPAALAHYTAGRFLDAANDAARRPQSADSLAFAARSLLAACVMGAADCPALLSRAEQLARTALRLAPRSVEARLQLAVVYGMRGRRASAGEAFARRYAPRGRRLIEQALAIAPDNAEARALLGVWHLEVLRRGGRLGAMVYGARVGAGVAAFDRALVLAPEDSMIKLHYAAALLCLDFPRNEAQVRRLLAAVSASEPHSALDTHARTLSQRLLQLISTEGAPAAANAARAAGL
jgi:hypothetical protein